MRLSRLFDRCAARYERGRPGYPPAAIRFLAREFRLGRGSTVVELASGTGKFTRALRPLGAAIVAVEPTEGMRREFRRRVPGVLVLEGSAEAIPLPDRFADAVVVAQAYHWFHPERAAREIARILRPGAGLAVVWNSRDDRVRWSRGLSEIVRRNAGDAGHGGTAWKLPFRRRGGPFTALRRREFRYTQRLSVPEAVDRGLSVSLVQALPLAGRRKVAREIRSMLASDPATRGRRTLTLPYETEVFYARRRGRRSGR